MDSQWRGCEHLGEDECPSSPFVYIVQIPCDPVWWSVICGCPVVNVLWSTIYVLVSSLVVMVLPPCGVHSAFLLLHPTASPVSFSSPGCSLVLCSTFSCSTASCVLFLFALLHPLVACSFCISIECLLTSGNSSQSPGQETGADFLGWHTCLW
jgi:hypothetical protein